MFISSIDNNHIGTYFLGYDISIPGYPSVPTRFEYDVFIVTINPSPCATTTLQIVHPLPTTLTVYLDEPYTLTYPVADTESAIESSNADPYTFCGPRTYILDQSWVQGDEATRSIVFNTNGDQTLIG